MSSLKALLGSKVRSNNGCWTCRLRRKKCDEKRPVCEGCEALEITCHFGDQKPDWMDSGPRQKDMAERIKSQVKKQASQRRDRKYMDMLEYGTRAVSLGGPRSGAARADADMSGTSDTDAPAAREDDSSPQSGNDSGSGSPPLDGPWHSQLFPCAEDRGGGPDVDVHFIMIYLDYVFPCLFPHYRPPVLVGGRGWILDVLQSSKAVYHTAISMSSYFFAVMLSGGKVGHAKCMDRMMLKLRTQLELGLRELQREVAGMNGLERRTDISEALEVMQSILLMVSFEVATCSSGSWRVHLDAAIATFLQILPLPDLWSETLNSMYTPRWPPPDMGRNRPWSTQQASLRFFTANLLYSDIMSSIALGTAPRLYRYQAHIIPSSAPRDSRLLPQTVGPLFMDEFIGVHNTVLQLLSDVSSLDSWKKAQVRGGQLYQNELATRGSILVHTIKSIMELMEPHTTTLAKDAALGNQALAFVVTDPLPDLYLGPDDVHPIIATHNLIWLQATLSYLHTVISGWRPSSPEIRESVSRTKELFGKVQGGMCLRAMIFPLCITGCLAAPDEEQAFRDLVSKLGPLQVFGTVKEAMEIMEKVWERRDELDENWDVAKCLSIPGYPVLLV